MKSSIDSHSEQVQAVVAKALIPKKKNDLKQKKERS
jgi:hypothetical protein